MGITRISTPAMGQHGTKQEKFTVVRTDIEVDGEGFDGDISVMIGPISHSVAVKVPPHSLLRYRFKPQATGELTVRVTAGNKMAEARLNL